MQDLNNVDKIIKVPKVMIKLNPGKLLLVQTEVFSRSTIKETDALHAIYSEPA